MPITLFLCGDVMLGRGVDQILSYPGEPQLRESSVRDARDYVALAIEKNGPISKPVDFRYVWGDALDELERVNPDFRIINLETTVTSSNSFWPNKDIHYRMNPRNVQCLKEAKIDCAVLANNHMLDFGYQGLTETVNTLNAAGVRTAGAGQNIARASEPAILYNRDQNRVLVYAYGHASSGVGVDWSAETEKPGVNFLRDFSDATLADIQESIARLRKPGDVVIISLHWGSNWEYGVEDAHRSFAHKLIDQGGVDVIYGHSSHHVRGIECHHGKIIFYGCGDFIDDYEGISGYEVFRDDLVLMYFLRIDPTDGSLLGLQMTPMQIKHIQLHHAARTDAQWLYEALTQEGRRLGTQFKLTPDGRLQLLCRLGETSGSTDRQTATTPMPP